MYRDEVIQMMTDFVDNYNRGNAKTIGMSEFEVEVYIRDNAYQLKYMNGLLYDLLKDNGVIA
jgi:hypothetical protein